MKSKFLILLLLIISINYLYAQNKIPNQIGGQAGSNLAGDKHFTFTIGQPILTESKKVDSTTFNWGFQFGYSNFENKDPLNAVFAIGSIPPFAFYEHEINPFYFKARNAPDSAVLSYKLSRNIDGFVEAFDSTFLQNDTFYAYIRLRVPSADTMPFAITFIAKHPRTGILLDSQRVDVNILKNPPIETTQFGVGNVQMPPNILSRDYFIVVEDSSQELLYFNGIQRRVRDIEVAALEVKIDRTMPPGPDNLYARFHSNGFTENANIRSVKIYTERLIINDSWRLPGTELTIFAREIIFADRTTNEISTLSTSPYPISLPLVNGQSTGLAGTNGGSIRIFSKTVHSGGKYRFTLNGGNGQNGGVIVGNQIKNGEPGDGGDLTSNLQIDNFTDKIGGVSGVGGPAAQRQRGAEGEFYFTGDTISWLHHNFLRIIFNYCDDLYMLGKVNEALAVINLYKTPLLDFAANQLLFPISGSSPIQQERSEIGMNISNLWDKFDALELRIRSGIDYFGNPPGWVPLLSTEMYASIYNIQLDQAFKSLFLSEMVKNANKVFTTRLEALKEIQADLNNQVITNIGKIEDLNGQSNDLDAQVQQNTEELVRLAGALENLSKELELRAQKSIESERKRKFWSGLCRSTAQIAKLIPDPIAQGISVGLTVTGGIIDNPPSDIKGWYEAGMNGFQSVQQAMSNFKYTEQHEKTKDSFKALVANGFCKDQELIACAQQQAKNLETVVGPFYEASKKVYEVFKSTTISGDEISEFASRLKAEDPMFRSLIERTAVIQQQNLEFMEQIRSNINETYNLVNKISSNLISLDGLSRMTSDANAKINLKVLQWTQDSEREAFYRLKRYHYLLAKSYEYRLCKPYPGDLNIESIFQQIKNLVEGAQDASLNTPQLNALKELFKDAALTPILNSIVQELTNNAANQENTINFTLDQADLDVLNKEGKLVFNPLEIQGFIDPGHEDIRIVSIKFDSILVRKRSQTGFNPNDNLTLTLNYPKYGRIRKGGEIFNFAFYSNMSEYGIVWEGQVFPGQGNIISPKAWGEDLELFFHMMRLIGNSENVSKDYSKSLARPPFMANMLLRRERELIEDLFADSLYFTKVTLNIKYGYRLKPNNRVIVNIKPNNRELAPLFELNRKDINQKQDGYGEIFRTFSRNSGSVTVSAPEMYGKYKFSRWRVYNGLTNSFPTSPAVNITTSNDAFLEAYYVYQEEKIVTTDTTWFGPEGSDENPGDDKVFLITGLGTYGTKTEYNADSIYAESLGGLSFVEPNNFNRGYLDSGVVKRVKLRYERNSTTANRKLGEIFTFAPGASQFVHKTVVMQCFSSAACNEVPTHVNDNFSISNNEIRIVPNPNNGLFRIIFPEVSYFDHVQIFDISGRVVYSQVNLTNNEINSLTLTGLNNGIYFCKVKIDKKYFSTKFILQQ